MARWVGAQGCEGPRPLWLWPASVFYFKSLVTCNVLQWSPSGSFEVCMCSSVYIFIYWELEGRCFPFLSINVIFVVNDSELHFNSRKNGL